MLQISLKPSVTSIIGAMTQTIVTTGGSTGTETLSFTISADGSTDNLITVEFEDSVCRMTDIFDAPVGCCVGEAKCGRVRN